MNILFPLHARQNYHPLVIQSKTDNNSARAWIAKCRCKSLALQTACMSQTYMQMNSKVDIASIDYYPGKDYMKDIDLESRREEFLAGSEFAKTLPPELEIDVDQYPIVRRFVQMADPTMYKDCLQDMHGAYLAVAREFGAFIHRLNLPGVQFKAVPARHSLVDFDHAKKRRNSVQIRHFV